MENYKNLLVWQKGVALVKKIYILTRDFPKDELYGLTSQMRRASISIPSNIAEGRMRESRKEFIRYLQIAIASGAELETQIEIAKHLEFGKTENFTMVENELDEIMRMLNKLINNNENLA